MGMSYFVDFLDNVTSKAVSGDCLDLNMCDNFSSVCVCTFPFLSVVS